MELVLAIGHTVARRIGNMALLSNVLGCENSSYATVWLRFSECLTGVRLAEKFVDKCQRRDSVPLSFFKVVLCCAAICTFTLIGISKVAKVYVNVCLRDTEL